MQTTPKPISTKSPRKTKNAARFLLDWAAVIALALCFIVFTLIKGNRFMSFNNMINIRARHVHHHRVRHRRYGYHGAGRL